ncbi:M1 family metallopeptidase [Blastococcus jejuensis]|uniref:Aminopeptidase N n=1 Tax=Blastococcus jejuensis TaxID=351224 RepID=A0ABP6PCK2_9ACTN
MIHRSKVLPLAAALVAALVVPLAGTASAQAPLRGTTGTAGIGDPYFPLDGNGGYDVAGYDLDLRYDPRTDRLSGKAVVTARATQNLSAFNLDFQGLTIRSITVNGKPATWSRRGGELTVRPTAALAQGSAFTVAVTYDGVPQTIGDPLLGVSGFIHTDDGAIVAGQPDVAATWFPANDHPRDAATFELSIAVPNGTEALSNGVLLGKQTASGWTTWNWRAAEPMATYLATLAVGQFDVRQYQRNGIRFWDALDPDLYRMPTVLDPYDPDRPTLGEIAEGSLARQPEIIRFLADFAGNPYPFTASGGIVDDVEELGFALETQTRPVYSPLFFQYDALNGDLVVVHELAHQWFGDDLRLKRWQDIWLNEGFATYSEWLWLEREGLITVQEIFDIITAIPADDPYWDVATGNPGPADLFDYEAVYERGGLVLHALRLAVGDRAFTRIVDQWAASQSGDTVTTDEFIALAERVAGRQLDALFHEWLFTAAKPASLGSADTAAAATAVPGRPGAGSAPGRR